MTVHRKILSSVHGKVGEKLLHTITKLPTHELLYIFRHSNLRTKLKLFRKISVNKKIQILSKLSEDELEEILNHLKNDEIKEIVLKAPYFLSIKILRILNEDRRNIIISALPTTLRDFIVFVLKYPDEAIINYIQRNIIVVDKDVTINEAINIIKNTPENYVKNYVFITDKNGNFLGYVPVYSIISSDYNKKLETLLVKPRYTISPSRDREDIIHFFYDCNCDFIPVVDNKRLLGIITSEIALKIVEEERSEDLFKLFSLQEIERIYDPISKSIRNRTPWLIINLFTAFLNSIVINPFQDLLKSFVLLAVFMPIVAGEAGNATTQTMAIIVRSLAINDIRPTFYDVIRAIKKELPIAIINSIIVGGIAAIFAYIWKGSLIISLALALAMLIDLIIAATMGVIIPVLLKKLGSDPATSSTIILTTFTDVFGFLSFLGISAVLMKIFGII